MLTRCHKVVRIQPVNYQGDIRNGRIAQLGERSPYKAEVTGSIPVPPTTMRGRSSARLERLPVTQEVASSSLVGPAI